MKITKTKVDPKTLPLPSAILGYKYVYHFNEYEKLWYCIDRSSYMNYWDNNKKRASDWVSGTSVEEAAGKMIKKVAKDQYNKEIEEAVKRVGDGKSVSNKQVMKELNKW